MVEDMRPTSEGIVLVLPKAKEDQEGRSDLQAIPFAADEPLCPVRRLKRWMTMPIDDVPAPRCPDFRRRWRMVPGPARADMGANRDEGTPGP